jgi:hypothetical protein
MDYVRPIMHVPSGGATLYAPGTVSDTFIVNDPGNVNPTGPVTVSDAGAIAVKTSAGVGSWLSDLWLNHRPLVLIGAGIAALMVFSNG